MQDSNNLALNRFFSQRLFDDLLEKDDTREYCSIIRRYVDDPESKTNGQLVSEIYSFMSKSYRNEYFYQNTLLNKLLLGKHSVSTTTALSQIPVANSKADFILINGKAVVYEIKTELDSLSRLNTQIRDYYMAFDHVCVVAAEKYFDRICELDDKLGVYALTSRTTISDSLKREPTKREDLLSHESMFSILRKTEYESIVKSYFGSLPDTTPVFHYGACLEAFLRIPMNEAYDLYLRELKKRNRIEKEVIDGVPYELRSLVYFSRRFRKRAEALRDFLNKPFGG